MTVKYIERRRRGLPEKPLKRIPKHLRPPKVRKKQTGYNDTELIEERDGRLWKGGREICGAQTRKRGKCDKCGFVPDSDEKDAYKPHRGVCEKCGGKMRCMNHMLSVTGTCRLHGGNTPSGPASPKWKGGISYQKYLPLRMADRFKTFMQNPDKLSAEKDVVLLETFIVDLMDKMVGERALEGIKDAYEDLKLAAKAKSKKKQDMIDSALKDMKKWLSKCNLDMDIQKEIKSLVEDKSRISAREAKRQIDLQMHLTAEQGSALMTIFAQNVIHRLDALPNMFSIEVQKKLQGQPLTIVNTVDLLRGMKEVIKREVANDMRKHMDHPSRGDVHDGRNSRPSKVLTKYEEDNENGKEEN